MQSTLMEKLGAHLLVNHPDLAVQLQENYQVTSFIEDRVAGIMPMANELITAGRPRYIVEELCMNELIKALGPSRFNYIKEIVETEFQTEYHRLQRSGVVTYEVINLVEACRALMDGNGFLEQRVEDRFLRYAVIAEISAYFN